MSLVESAQEEIESEICKNKVMRCSMYGNASRMHLRLNGELFEEVDCFKYLMLPVAADGEKKGRSYTE